MCTIEYADETTICEAPGTRLTTVKVACSDPMVSPICFAEYNEGFIYVWDRSKYICDGCGRHLPCRHCTEDN